MDEPTQPSIQEVSWLPCSSSVGPSLFPCGSQTGSHRLMWRWRNPAQCGFLQKPRERSVPQPQLKHHLGPLCRVCLPSWPWTIPNSSPWCFLCHCCGANWRREMKWNKRMKEGYSCFNLITSAEKMSNHGSEKQNLWGVLTPGRESSNGGRESINMCFSTNCIPIYYWTLALFY